MIKELSASAPGLCRPTGPTASQPFPLNTIGIPEVAGPGQRGDGPVAFWKRSAVMEGMKERGRKAGLASADSLTITETLALVTY